MSDLKIEIADGVRVDELRDLWLALHHHPKSVATLQPLVADDEASWRRRRALYAESLSAGRGFLAIATDDDRPVGYAMVRIEQGLDDTWPVNEHHAELFSLSVAPEERGHGIGGALFEAVDTELSRRGITDLVVAVMTGNAAAMRFYGAAWAEAGGIAPVSIWAPANRTPREVDAVLTPPSPLAVAGVPQAEMGAAIAPVGSRVRLLAEATGLDDLKPDSPRPSIRGTA